MLPGQPTGSASIVSKSAEAVNTVAEQDGSVLVVPIGSIEQHGDHLPVGTDSILVTEVAHRGAETAEDDVPLLVAPPIWTGNSPHHFPFGGTLSITPENLERVLVDLADSTVKLGIDGLVLLNGHGGNKSLIRTAVSRIGDAHPDLEVVGCTYFDLAGSFIGEIRESEVGGTGHAGELETSLMLYLHPELVDIERAKSSIWDSEYDHAGNDMFAGSSLSVYRTMDEYTDTGVSGDPTVGTEENGRKICAGLSEELGVLFTQVYDNAQP